MAFDELLANRLRENLMFQKHIEEKHMFGGVCFMLNDKMCIGVVKEELMCRIDPELEYVVLEKHGCRPMDFTGKKMKGYVYVNQEALKSEEEFNYWVQLCIDFNPIAKVSKKKK